jgi:hypothetical protein
VSPVKYELGFYITEDGILQLDWFFGLKLTAVLHAHNLLDSVPSSLREKLAVAELVKEVCTHDVPLQESSSEEALVCFTYVKALHCTVNSPVREQRRLVSFYRYVLSPAGPALGTTGVSRRYTNNFHYLKWIRIQMGESRCLGKAGM